MTSAKFTAATTSADGTSFVALNDLPCHFVHVLNKTGTPLTFKYATDDGVFVLPDGMAWSFRGLNNANQLSVKRTDESTSQVTLNSIEVEL